MSIPESVTIVGGGVVGCFLAYRLALEGVPVTLIERQHVGAGASGASAGNVQPGDVETALAAESLGLFRRFVPRIKAESGIDPLDHDVQYIYAALDEQGVAQTQQFATALQQEGLRVEWIDGKAARAIEPHLAPNVLGGALHQDCMQIDGYRFVSALSQAAQRHGAQLRQAEAVGLQRTGRSGERCAVAGRHHGALRHLGFDHGRVERHCGFGLVKRITPHRAAQFAENSPPPQGPRLALCGALE